MKGQARWFMRSVFTTAALSNTALLIWAPFPILSTVIVLPFGLTGSDPRSWLIVVAAQVLFSALVIAGRWIAAPLGRNHPRTVVVIVIVIAGAVRGAGVLLAAAAVTATDPTSAELGMRALTSAVIAVPALGLAGVIVQFNRDYRHDFEQLRNRAMRLEQEVTSPTQSLSDATIASWVGVRRSLQSTALAARRTLADDDISPQSLNSAADVIAEALTQQVRPISHGLWSGPSDEPPRLRARLVAWDALRPWQPPIATIIVLFAVTTAIGAINRAGFTTGIIFATYTTAVMALALLVSAAFGRRYPAQRIVGIVTLVAVPIVIVASTIIIGQGIVGAEPDIAGRIIVSASSCIVIGGGVFLRRVTIERDALLDALQARIEAQAVDVLAKRAEADTWSRSLGTFVHHSVQSELTALRMQLMEAAVIDDETQRAATRADALARFDRLLALQPPWVQQRPGRTVVADVAQAWAGIAEITVTATDTGTDDQWAIAGHVVEEGVANAVRAGGARQVRVDIAAGREDSLVITIEDDGRGISDSINPGLGTWWLDQIAPGAWQRQSAPTGTQLVVRIR